MPTTSNFGWTTPADTDLVKDGALAIRTLGNGIDTSMAELKGGTTGQVLSKTSNTDMDFTWVTTDDANAIQNAIVDAKGDLIAASANDTPARLAVGNNGETLLADSSQTTGLRYNPQNALANPIINGGMDVWQRGTSISLSASSGNTYVADRWMTGTGANQACTVSRQATGDTTNLPNIQYALRFQRNSGQTGTGGINLTTSLESTNSIPFAGKSITLSFYGRKGANLSSGTFNAYLITGTGTDQNRQTGAYTGENSSISSAISLTTTWTRYVITGTIPTTATEMAIQFFFDFAGTAGAADYFEMTGFQIDLGTYTASSAPTFRRSGGTLAGELQACQRYYYRLYPAAASRGLGNGQAYSTTAAYITVPFPVEMRTRPTAIEQSGTAGDYSLLASTATANACNGVPTFDAGTTTRAGFFTATTTAVLTAGNATFMTTTTGVTTGYLGWSAEL